jgi:pyruvate dehydrogenase E1 component
MQDAITRILGPDPEDRFWYLTLYNETYPMPALPEGQAGDDISKGIVEGIYRYSEGPYTGTDLRASLCFSGPMWSVAQEAQELLGARWGVSADTWAVTSWNRLRTEALEVERWNRLHPGGDPHRPLVTHVLGAGPAPVVAITDYMRAVPDQVARFIDRPYTSLGTDGFGRSDARGALREHFEVDAAQLVVAVLSELARSGQLPHTVVKSAISELGIDPWRAAPFLI